MDEEEQREYERYRWVRSLVVERLREVPDATPVGQVQVLLDLLTAEVNKMLVADRRQATIRAIQEAGQNHVLVIIDELV